MAERNGRGKVENTLTHSSSSPQSSNKTMSSDSSAPKSVTVEEMSAAAGEEEESAIEERYSLYEAYNELHALAQELETPFEAPAVLVVGQQTDGKSALVEALMGFQFNHVGGGTKTRRPITLHMKYDPQCQFPLCHLGSDDDPSVALPKSLSQIQVRYAHLFECSNNVSTSSYMIWNWIFRRILKRRI